MAASNWEMQSGDPARFAFKLSFLRNPHGGDDFAAPEEALSWGNFTVWAGGENLCAHIEQDEILDSAHWYMLPLLEWFVRNWDAIFHEEAPPLRNDGFTAAEILAKSKNPPISLKEVDEFEWMDKWTAWWDRHNLRSQREGGVFPDLYLRRFRDTLEVSTGGESLLCVPKEFSFLAPNRRYVVQLEEASDSLYKVLKGAAEELDRRLPDSSRIRKLISGIDDLSDPGRRDARMAWLARCEGDVVAYQRIAQAVGSAFSEAPAERYEEIAGRDRHKPLVAVGSAYAQLVFGAYSPSVTEQDVRALSHAVIHNYVADASDALNRLNLDLGLAGVKDLRPGEQGSRLGERASESLFSDQSTSWIDVRRAVAELGVTVSGLSLTDSKVRAVSVFGPTQSPAIFYNSQFKWGVTEEITRFTLAHELCHLILDRDYANELALASGPWAPLDIEQRANAFAASFLMPTWLLRQKLAQLNGDVAEFGVVVELATALHVSVTSVIDRLHNLGELDVYERNSLHTEWRRTR